MHASLKGLRGTDNPSVFLDEAHRHFGCGQSVFTCFHGKLYHHFLCSVGNSIPIIPPSQGTRAVPWAWVPRGPAGGFLSPTNVETQAIAKSGLTWLGGNPCYSDWYSRITETFADRRNCVSIVHVSHNRWLVKGGRLPDFDHVREHLAFAVGFVLHHDTAVFVQQVGRPHCLANFRYPLENCTYPAPELRVLA